MSINRDFADLARSSQPGRNMLINGAMSVSQRGTSFTSFGASDSEYGVDRWKIRTISSASARWTASQEASGGDSGKDNWLKLLCTTADGSPGADETQWITQPIEGYNSTSVVATDASTKSMSVSLDIIAHADGASSISFPAKACVTLDMSQGASRSYLHDVTIAAADTWERVTFSAPADSFNTWVANNAANLFVGVSLYGGSNRVGTADTWAVLGRDTVTSNTDNWADATNNYIGFTNVQIEVGSVATDFAHEDYGTTLHKCMRYYERKTNAADNFPIAGSSVLIYSTTNGYVTIPYLVPKRATPTIGTLTAGDFYMWNSGAGGLTVTSISLSAQLQAMQGGVVVSGGGFVAGNSSHVAFKGTNKYIEIIAEL
jgi:hypothetical protein